jgi:pimeloyl-ACP methyl ester carboxylesterase
VWLSYRRIEPDLERVARKAESLNLRIHLYFGAHDRVIPPDLGENLARFAPSNVSQHVLPFGHVLLTTELAEAIAADSAAGVRLE